MRERRIMIRRTALTIVLLAGCVWCLTLVARADSEPSSQSDSFKPAASIDALMYGQSQHFKTVGQLVKNKSAKDRADRLAMEAEVLAELANVNTFHKDKADYRGWAETLRDTSLELAAEARKKKDADQSRLESLRKKLKKTCIACHDMYQ